jgi:hypothetical protein
MKTRWDALPLVAATILSTGVACKEASPGRDATGVTYRESADSAMSIRTGDSLATGDSVVELRSRNTGTFTDGRRSVDFSAYGDGTIHLYLRSDTAAALGILSASRVKEWAATARQWASTQPVAQPGTDASERIQLRAGSDDRELFSLLITVERRIKPGEKNRVVDLFITGQGLPRGSVLLDFRALPDTGFLRFLQALESAVDNVASLGGKTR